MSGLSLRDKAIIARKLALAAYQTTISDPQRLQTIDNISRQTSMLLDFIYGYTFIEDEALDTDDEIINWTFVDVSDDLNAATWNISCGFYKTAASCLRNALDLAMAALYFQIRANLDTEGDGYRKFFAAWDCGNRDTPSWGETTVLMRRHQSIELFNREYNCDVVVETYNHFKYLCNFTHGRPFAKTDKSPTNSAWLGGATPEFDSDAFDKLIKLARETIASIATSWLVAYPQILSTDPLNGLGSHSKYRMLLSNKRGEDALAFARNSLINCT